MSSEDRKRRLEDDSSTSDGSDDELMGPSLMPSTKVEQHRKKKKVIDEAILLDNLPLHESYRYSYRNESVVTCICKSLDDTIIIAGFKNGTIKFWTKKQPKENYQDDEQIDGQLEFVKSFFAHPDKSIAQLILDEDGSKLVSVAQDDTSIKVFDLISFDMVQVIDLGFLPNTETKFSSCWFKVKNENKLLVNEKNSNKLYVINTEFEDIKPIKVIHKHTLHSIVFNPKYKCFVSADVRGIVEYWSPTTFDVPEGIDFKYKSETDLLEFVRNKSKPFCLALSHDNELIASMSYPDNLIRIFKFKSGKLLKKFDESIESYGDSIDLRLINHERNLYNNNLKDLVSTSNLLFEKNDKLLIFGTILGIKILNLQTNKVIKVLGTKDQLDLNIRFNQLILVNKLNVNKFNKELLSSNNTIVSSKLMKNPLIIATSINSNKLFVYNNKPGYMLNRDIDLTTKTKSVRTVTKYSNVILHTTLGDIKIKLFNKLTPKTVESFIKLCESNYYNNIIFHRVIKNFMVQTGDPLGNGTGGESAWGGYFKDEFNSLLSHTKPFMVSMANSGPNTNGSQFFITTEKANWLDNKHTIFGEVVQGFDTVRSIENLETDENDKPLDQVAILSTTLEA